MMLVALLAASAALGAPAEKPGVFVVGIDGMDPVILQRMIDQGKTPHLAKLAQEGTFQTLATVTPPQSPVAWSSFVTGMGPGGHGVFDFIHRDPATYRPVSSATTAVEQDPSYIKVFGHYIPLGGEDPANNRSGKPFWDVLKRNGVPVEVYRIPGNFPVPASEANVLAGMGVVDMRGGYGTYSLYTTRPPKKDDPKGDVQIVTVEDFDLDGTPDTATGTLRGPPNLFKMPPGKTPELRDYLTQRVTFHVDPEHPTVLIEVAGQSVLLREGEWSDWVELDYSALLGGAVSFSGTVRFYAQELRPGFRIYASPVNISAASPSPAISSPEDFATDIYENMGHYYTQGMPEETNALKDGVFDDDEYVRQVALVQEDTRAMLDVALRRFQPGDFTFFYASDVDLQCHMLWRHADPKHPELPPHPAHNPHTAEEHAEDIAGYYASADALVGSVLDEVPEGTLVVVMSDHGFQPFRRKVHLNAWLRDHGYLTLKEGKRTGHVATGDVDWSKTKAYALGFNSLYLNIAGREAEGIVAPGEADALRKKLKAELEAFTDPANGASVVLRVDLAEDVYSGARVKEAPDLLVGYDQPYGGSDENTLGEVREPQIEDNTSKWSGSHLIAPELVPGVLLTNRKLKSTGHSITELAGSFLTVYGLSVPEGMKSATIF